MFWNKNFLGNVIFSRINIFWNWIVTMWEHVTTRSLNRVERVYGLENPRAVFLKLLQCVAKQNSNFILLNVITFLKVIWNLVNRGHFECNNQMKIFLVITLSRVRWIQCWGFCVLNIFCMAQTNIPNWKVSSVSYFEYSVPGYSAILVI